MRLLLWKAESFFGQRRATSAVMHEEIAKHRSRHA